MGLLCVVGKYVFALFTLQSKKFASFNFNDKLLYENWGEDLVNR